MQSLFSHQSEKSNLIKMWHLQQRRILKIMTIVLSFSIFVTLILKLTNNLDTNSEIEFMEKMQSVYKSRLKTIQNICEIQKPNRSQTFVSTSINL